MYSTTGAIRQLYFVVGDTTVTGTDITANPQISAGATLGAELVLVGTDDTKFVLLEDGNGLKLNGPMSLYQYSKLHLFWNGSVWDEMYRRA